MDFDETIRETRALRLVNGIKAAYRRPSDGQAADGRSFASAVEDPVVVTVSFAEASEAPAAETTPAAEPARLAAFAETDDIAAFAETDDIAAFAETDDIAAFAETDDIAAFAGSGGAQPPRRIRRTSGSAPAPGRGRRRVRSKAAVGFAGAAALIIGSAGIAAANAPDPVPPTTGTVTVSSPGGPVTVQVGGPWDWGSVAGLSGGNAQDCSGRFGTGWAVDWWGLGSSPTATSIPGLTNGSGVDLDPGGSIETSTGQYFFVNTTDTGTVSGVPAMGPGGGTTTQAYNYDGYANFATACTPDASGDASGTWSAEAIYPNAASVPPQLCVILYDMHGSEGDPSNNANDYSTTGDGDNSIQTNVFNPATNAGYCFTPKFVPTVTTTTSPSSGTVGSSFHDSASLTGLVGTTTGETVSFSLYPSSACTAGTAVSGSPVTATLNSSGSTGTSPGITVSTAGTYYWQASYPGDAKNTAATSSCSSEPITVTAIPTTQSLTGQVFLCSNGNKTLTPETGTINAQGAVGADTYGPSASPATFSVAADTYSVTASSPPAGDEFVSCGGTAVPSGSGSSSTSTQTGVVVASGGSGTATFYVAPIPAQSLTGQVFLCSNGNKTLTPETGTINAQGAVGADTYGPSASPATFSVAADTYSVTASSPPAGDEFVSCGGTAVPSGSGSSSTSTQTGVVVASGGSGTASFYVAPIPAQSLTGQVFLCSSGNQTNTPETGTINAQGAVGADTYGPSASPATFSVAADTYSVTASSPPAGDEFVSCGGTAVPSGSGSSSTSTQTGVVVASGGSGTANFYVAPIPGTPSLVVLKTGPAVGAPGDQGTYTLKVTNNGTGASTAQDVTDLLPTGETYVSDTDGCTATGQSLSCPVAAGLAANASTSFNVTVSYGSATAGQALTDCASVGAGSPCSGCAMVGGTPCTNCPTPGVAGSASCATTDIVDVGVVKTNNAADPAGTSFLQTETAPTLNEPFTYQAVITNNSLVPELITSISDVVGSNASASVTCTNAGGPVANTTVLTPGESVTCQFAGTAPGTNSASLSDTITVVAASTTTPADTTTANSTSTVLTPGAANLVVLKTGPAVGAPGDQGTYTLKVTNGGSGASTAQDVTDLLPTGETYVSDTDGCTATGQSLSCPVAAGLAANASTSFNVTVSYGSATAGQALTDCASVGAGSPCSGCAMVGGTPCTNCPTPGVAGSASCATTDIVDVGVVKTNNAADPAGTSFLQTETAPTLNEPFTYQAVITNNSLVPELITSISDVVGSNASASVTCTNAGGPVANTTVLTPGESVTCQFAGTAPGTNSASLSDTITVVAASTTTPADTTTANSTSTVLTPGAANLVVLKTGPAVGAPGDQGTYTLKVTNGGSGASTAQDVTDLLPTGETYVSDTDGCTATGQSLSCPVAALAASASVSFNVTVSYGSATAGQALTDCASVGAGSPCSGCAMVGGTPCTNCPTPGVAGSASCATTDIVDVGVVKTNNAADPAGTSFLQTETAPTLNEPFTYQAVITNNSLVPELITSISDVVGSNASASVTCTNAGGPVANTTVLTPGESVTCQFAGTAPGTNSASLSDTITVVAASTTTPADTTTGTSTSTVLTPAAPGCTVDCGGCVVNCTSVTPSLAVSVVKTNNAADPTGATFSQTQTAPTPGETFTYQAVITNTSATAEDITSITDLLPAGTPTGVCANLIGTTLAASGSAGDSVTCQFSGTAPTTNGASITDTVTVVVNQPGNPGNTTTGTSTSTVLTPPTVGITKANNAAGTGYGPSEIATDGETSVPYQVVVTNTNSSPGTITVLTDTVDGSTTNICPTDIGLVLAAGASVTCDFTGPVPTTATTDTAGVTLSVNGQMVSGTATSTVFPPVLGVTITKKPPTTVPTVPVTVTPPPTPVTPSLPFTGAPISRTAEIALGLVLAGLLMLGALFLTERRKLATVRNDTKLH